MDAGKLRKLVKALFAVTVMLGLVLGANSADARRRRRRPKPPAVQPTPQPQPVAPQGINVQYFQASKPIAAQSDGRVTVICPDGLQLLGGGAYLSGRADDGYLNSSTPNAFFGEQIPIGWTGQAVNTSDVAQTLYVTANCASGEGLNVVYPRHASDVPGLDGVGLIANCPAGTQLTGGGINQTGIPAAGRFSKSAPSDSGNGWSAHVRNLGLTTHEAYLTAICASAPGLNVVKVSDSIIVGTYRTNNTSTACPAGMTIVGGGAALNSQTSMQASQGYINTSSTVGAQPSSSWAGWAANLGNTDLELRVTAFCIETA